MHSSIILPALFGASALAMSGSLTASSAVGQPTSCEAQAPGLAATEDKQLVTVVHVSNEDGSQLRYFPENIEAPVGSIVQFQFHPINHTVTESSFDAPCRALDPSLTRADRPGQRSGFVPVRATDTDLKIFNVLVNDTLPIWLFCGQGNHCRDGMSMVINEPKNNPDRNLAKYKEAASKVPARGAPAPAASSSAAGSLAPSAEATNTLGQAQAVSGTGTGIPASVTGAAPRNSIHYAGYAGFVVAGLIALL